MSPSLRISLLLPPFCKLATSYTDHVINVLVTWPTHWQSVMLVWSLSLALNNVASMLKMSRWRVLKSELELIRCSIKCVQAPYWSWTSFTNWRMINNDLINHPNHSSYNLTYLLIEITNCSAYHVLHVFLINFLSTHVYQK